MSVQNGRREGLWTLVGFNGELHEPGSHWQILGNGRRVYNPVLCRFHSPDPLSPFGRGGVNAYAYCGCDPVNYTDPDGTFALPLMMLGLAAGAGGAAAAALASPSNNEGGGSATPWIVGGVIAAVALLAGAGIAGRGPAMKLLDSSRSPRGATWANRAGGTSSGVPRAPSPAPPPRPASPPASTARSSSPGPERGPNSVRRDKDGILVKRMDELPSPVSKRIEAIRDFGPRGRTPDPAQVRMAKPYDNANGRLPPDRTGHYYHRHLVNLGTGHGYEGWRIVTGSSRQGLHVVYVTPNHDASFFKVNDWSGYR
ncbi:MAG: RHS repeat-associated core domain-containing protein [Stenotrophomonas sp.]|uniref:RHS repeat-associated core domain-containing protein n=1 Tax=Stenotrophomonas sp. TaxID=69392 RepID=UPI003D6D0874